MLGKDGQDQGDSVTWSLGCWLSGEEAFYRDVNLDMVSRSGEKIEVMLGRHGRVWGSLTWALGFWPGLWAVGDFCRVFDF